MEFPYLFKPHPYLTEPILYVVNIPPRAKWKHIQAAFATCGPVTSGGRTSVPDAGRRRWKVLFRDLMTAEMALATLSDTTVQGELPEWHLLLSHSLTADLPMPDTALLPLCLNFHNKNDTPNLPDAQTIFRWFRRAGPLYSLRMGVDIGYDEPACLVEYWDEEHLWFARRAGSKISPDAERALVAPVGVIDPWNLYCAGLGEKIDVDDLHNTFSEFGRIIASRIIKLGKPDAFSFVTFMHREDAARAMHEMRGTILVEKKLVVRYHKPPGLKLRPHPDALLSNVPWYNTSRNDDTAAHSPHQQDGQEKEQETHPNEEEIRTKETLDAEARKKEAEEAALRGREARLKQAKLIRLAADATVRKTMEATTHASIKESSKLEELEKASMAEESAKKLLQFAQSVFEEAKRSFEIASERLEHARRTSEKVTSDKEKAHAGLQDSIAERVLAEAAEASARDAREQAQKEEQDALQEVHECEPNDEELEARRRKELEESIKKLSELREREEADRRERQAKAREEEIWESLKRMAEFEAQEKERIRAQKEAEERAREAARKAKEERERRAREEAEKKARELHEKQERARLEAEQRRKRYVWAAAQERVRCKKRDEVQWPKARIFWSNVHALARFRLVSTEFDSIKFCDTQPLTFESIPWPVLLSPYSLSVDHIDWQAVEDFFRHIEVKLDDAEYRIVVEKTHRRFHPDKWRSRGLLNTIVDEELRSQLEAAGNVVAQAMTPIWLKSRS